MDALCLLKYPLVAESFLCLVLGAAACIHLCRLNWSARLALWGSRCPPRTIYTTSRQEQVR